jgi:hypothetical protein
MKYINVVGVARRRQCLKGGNGNVVMSVGIWFGMNSSMWLRPRRMYDSVKPMA